MIKEKIFLAKFRGSDPLVMVPILASKQRGKQKVTETNAHSPEIIELERYVKIFHMGIYKLKFICSYAYMYLGRLQS